MAGFLNGVKNFFIGQNRDEAMADYKTALENASKNRNIAQATQDYTKEFIKNNQEALSSSPEFMSRLNSITSDDYMSQYDNDLNTYQKMFDRANKQNQYNIFGNGVLGTPLNNLMQVGSAISDLSSKGTNAWKDNGTSSWTGKQRDAISDIGAGGELAFDIATLLLPAASSAGSFAKSAARGFGVGGAGGALSSLKDYGKDIFTEEGLTDLGLRTGIGGLVGGGISGLGYGINKYANTAQGIRSPYAQYMAMAEENNPKADWVLNRGNLAKTKLGQAVQGVGDTISARKLTGNTLGNNIVNSKVGKATSKILNTKTGKIGAGVGAGLVLNKIFNGGNNQELSDEELDELYNYYYGGQ